MSTFLVPFIAQAHRAYWDHRELLEPTDGAAFAHTEAHARVERALYDLSLSVDDVRDIFRAVAEVDRVDRRTRRAAFSGMTMTVPAGIRLPYGRALAMVRAPVDFLASAQASGPCMFVRSVGAIPAGVPVERFRAASRPVVRPSPLRGL